MITLKACEKADQKLVAKVIVWSRSESRTLEEELSESLTLTLNKQLLQKMTTKEQVFVQSKKTEITNKLNKIK